jgi:molecular chaperone DnaK
LKIRTALYHDEQAKVLRNRRGNENTPVIFGLEKKSERPVIGEAAKFLIRSAPTFCVTRVRERLRYGLKLSVGGQHFTPTEVAAHLFQHVKRSAEEQLDEEVDRCVITVPANFADPARRATRQAGEIAGMTVERIVNEPTAAALAYGHAEGIEEEHIMVYDLGGGTFDVSIVEYMDDVLDVAASSGDPHLGGKDFDEALRAHVAERFEDQTGVAVEEGTGNYYRLLHACEAAKKELSFNRKTTVNIPFFAVQDGTPVDLNVAVRRSTFEDMIRPMIDRTEEAIEKALSDAELARRDIDRIVLVGGSTRIPYVQMFVEEVMGRKPLKHIDPDKAVALGAAVQTAIVDGKTDQIIMDVCPLSLGTSAIDLEMGGARPGRYSEIVATNAKVLKPYTREFHTMHPDQEVIDFRVYQRDSLSDSKQAEIEGEPNEEEGFTLLGREEIDVPPGGKQQEIEATYTYNPDGLIEVTVHFPESGKKHEFTTRAELDEEEIEASRQRVEKAWKESEFLEDVEALMDAAQRELEEGTVPTNKEKQLKDLMQKMKQALAANDKDRIHELENEITDVLFELDL